MNSSDMKAVYIIVSAGFAEEIVDFIRAKGSSGATIINARGVSPIHREILGISTDSEKEIILTINETEVTEQIMEAMKQNAGFRTKAHGICFAVPVTKTIGIGEYRKKND